MQLRKVCNHPDLFDERTTSTPLDCNEIEYNVHQLVDIRDGVGGLIKGRD